MLTPRHENYHYIDALELEISELTAHMDASKARLLELIREFDVALGRAGGFLIEAGGWDLN